MLADAHSSVVTVASVTAAALCIYLSRTRAKAPPKKPLDRPLPTGRRFKGMPVPFWFQDASAAAFGEMEPAEDDVFMCSLGKGGTTLTNKILHLILYGIDDEGKPVDGADKRPGSKLQCYPEGIKVEPSTGEAEGPEKMRRGAFGDWGLCDLLAQPAPRLFSTHLFGDMLPAKLLAPDGTGRLVLVLRNLKDVLVSLHFFNGEAKDGWLGNEHGPGSFARFIDPDSPNAYGSPFRTVREMDAMMRALQPTGRVLVVYYEDLIAAMPAQLERIAAFLGRPLTAAKRDAVLEASSFESMKKAGGFASVLLRKGGSGGWRKHLTAEQWAAFDAAFDAQLKDVEIAEPLRFHQAWAVTGMPPARASQTVHDDPRTYAKFVRHTLVDGHVVRDRLIAPDRQAFVRPPSEFNGVVEPPGTKGAKHVAEAGRYHLWVSGVCPWASSTRAARHLLGLHDAVSMEVADGQSSAGWVLLGGSACPPWAGRAGPFFLHEAYQASDPFGTTRITMPVLWDKKLGVIVSNDSWSICKMFGAAFAPLGTSRGVELVPRALAAAVEETHAHVYKHLLNAVYRAGIGLLKGLAEAHAEADADVAATLAALDATLASQRFLLPRTTAPTAVDLRLTMTLLRFDVAYLAGFAIRSAKGGVLIGDAYPHLQGYVRDMYARIQPEVDWPSFLQYYRWAVGHPADQPLPDVEAVIASAAMPHGRGRL